MPRPVRLPDVVLLGLLSLLPACASLYPPAVEAPVAPPAAPAAKQGSVPSGARIQLMGADDPGYAALAGSGVEPAFPEAPERLLVLHEGSLVLDLGIHLSSAEERGRAPLEEQVALADDASAAVIVRVERKTSAPEQTTVTWLPAANPQGAWKKALEPGHRVPLALPIPSARGLALVMAVPDAPDDLRVYGTTGAETFRLAAAPANVTELRASQSGRFVGADLAFVPRVGFPDRAVWVHDVVSRTAWIHSWSYGADEEVTAWRLLEDGTLEVDTAGFTLAIGPGDRVFERTPRRR